MSTSLSGHQYDNEEMLENFHKKKKIGVRLEYTKDYYNVPCDSRNTMEYENNGYFNMNLGHCVENKCDNSLYCVSHDSESDSFKDPLDIEFLHPRDTSGYTSSFPSVYSNDLSRFNLPLISSPNSSPMTPNYESSVIMTVDLQETLFNRLQWYHVTCKFVNTSGIPMYGGCNVILDQSVQFVDGRRRNYFSQTQNPIDQIYDVNENTIYINAIGTCASTGDVLQKCKRCKEKDKSLRKRKRKRIETEIWNDLDEENNNKLIQLFSSGENVIDENGELKFRIRIGCCVGVSKQHHINHVKYENGKEKLEIHKNCEGLLLTLQAIRSPNISINCFYSKPIRILGKVTEADRQKFSPDFKFLEKDEPYNPPISSPESDIEDVGIMFQSSRSFLGCSSCAAKGDRELFSKVDPSKVKPSILLQHFAKTFKNVFENCFTKRQITNMCNDSFFANPPLDCFQADTPSMLQVYTILAVGACMSGYLDTADKFWDRATKLADFLSLQSISQKSEVLLLADGLNRVSFYYGSGSDPEKGSYFSEKSFSCLHSLSEHCPEVLDMDVYETTLWSRATYKMDKTTLEDIRQWASKRNNLDILSYINFLNVITQIVPDLVDFVNKKTNSTYVSEVVKSEPDEFKNAFNDLKNIFEKAGYRNLVCGNHKYSKLIDDGFGCIEAWMKGDKVKGLELARSAAIQCSLLEHPQFPSLIPTYFACIVCAKVAETKHPSSLPYIDYAELCIKSFSRVTHFRWVRIIADFFIKKIDYITGRCIEMNTCPLRDRNFDNFST